MSDQQGRALLLGAFIVGLTLIVWDEITVKKVPPRPARFVGVGIAFGLLGLATPVITYKLAGLFGAGFALTLLYQHYAKAGEIPGNTDAEKSGNATPEPGN